MIIIRGTRRTICNNYYYRIGHRSIFYHLRTMYLHYTHTPQVDYYRQTNVIPKSSLCRRIVISSSRAVYSTESNKYFYITRIIIVLLFYYTRLCLERMASDTFIKKNNTWRRNLLYCSPDNVKKLTWLEVPKSHPHIPRISLQFFFYRIKSNNIHPPKYILFLWLRPLAMFNRYIMYLPIRYVVI